MIVSGLFKPKTLLAKSIQSISYVLKRDLFYSNLKSFLKKDKFIKESCSHKYPQLILDKEKNSLCISCKLCEEICPTNALKVKKSGLVNFPEKSLKSGDAPLSLKLNMDLCVKCKLCVQICPIDALSSTAGYSRGVIDLTRDFGPL